MTNDSRSLVAKLIDKIAPGLRHPQLFGVLLALFLIDLVIPDPLPLIDEIMLGLLTFIAGTWKTRNEPPPPRDVTPPEEPAPEPGDGLLPPGQKPL
jgi:hypothetical protein